MRTHTRWRRAAAGTTQRAAAARRGRVLPVCASPPCALPAAPLISPPPLDSVGALTRGLSLGCVKLHALQRECVCVCRQEPGTRQPLAGRTCRSVLRGRVAAAAAANLLQEGVHCVVVVHLQAGGGHVGRHALAVKHQADLCRLHRLLVAERLDDLLKLGKRGGGVRGERGGGGGWQRTRSRRAARNRTPLPPGTAPSPPRPAAPPWYAASP